MLQGGDLGSQGNFAKAYMPCCVVNTPLCASFYSVCTDAQPCCHCQKMSYPQREPGQWLLLAVPTYVHSTPPA